MNPSEATNRRDFLKGTAVLAAAGLGGCAATDKGGAGAQAHALPKPKLRRKIGPNDKIRVGSIGVNGQGNYSVTQLLKQPDVEFVAVCDVCDKRRDGTIARIKKAAGKGDPKPYTDFRKVLDRTDIDAVVIATPPHWHCLMGIMACEAGKDFYLEKPMTLHPAETRALLNAVRHHKAITQIGTQIHAVDNYRRVVEYVRSGKLGKISTVRTFNIQNQGPNGIGNAPNGNPPTGVVWEMWVGPAKFQKFNPTLFTGSFHHCSWMAYSGGWTPGMAPHIIDLPIWALELGCPTRVSATGGRYVIQDAGDAYDNHEVLWSYPGFTMTWMSSVVNSYGWDFGHGKRSRRLGIYFHGVNGTMFSNYGMHKIEAEGDFLKTIKDGKDTDPPPQSVPKSKGHHREWLDGIKTRTQPLCHVGYHANVDICCTTSLLAMKLGRTIHLDPKTLKIVGDDEAAKAAIPIYRDPWKFPARYL